MVASLYRGKRIEATYTPASSLMPPARASRVTSTFNRPARLTAAGVRTVRPAPVSISAGILRNVPAPEGPELGDRRPAAPRKIGGPISTSLRGPHIKRPHGSCPGAPDQRTLWVN